MKFKQYPYNLYLEKVSGGQFDGNGMPVPDTKEWVLISKCRDIPAGSGNIITTIDGQKVEYGSGVVMPVGTVGIEANDIIKIEDENSKIRLKGTVIRFAKMQLHSRLWV